MASITTDEHGVSDCICNGQHWLVVYQGTKLAFFGQHAGETTTKGTIEYFNTEEEALARVATLGITIPEGE